MRKSTKKLTTKEFIKKANKVHKNKYNYSKVVYVNSKSKVIIICPEHGKFCQTPDCHTNNKQGCPKCSIIKVIEKLKSTTEEFIVKAKKIHSNKYDYSKVNYMGANNKVIIICPTHGKFQQTPDSHLQVHGCQKCAKNTISLKNKLSKDQIAYRAKTIHRNKYNYNKVVYENITTKVIIVCPIHGEFLQSINDHLNGKHGCPFCAGLKKLTTEEFIVKARKVHGNKFNYGKVDYKGNHKKVIIICPKHGKFLQMPYSHLAGKGCLICSGLKKFTKDQFIIKSRKIHGNKYGYNEVVYINSLTKIIITCPKHGNFYQKPSSHLQGEGCPECKKSNGEKIIAKILDNKKIEYIRQKTFPDCKNPKTNHILFYDFCLQECNMLIEYNGPQHYTTVNYWHHNKYALEDLQYRDAIKHQYALSHGYKFLVIKYNENIEEKLKKALSI